MIKISPYLTFNGNCREAMEFYNKCLGGELKIMAVGDAPNPYQSDPRMKNMVATARDRVTPCSRTKGTTTSDKHTSVMPSAWIILLTPKTGMR